MALDYEPDAVLKITPTDMGPETIEVEAGTFQTNLTRFEITGAGRKSERNTWHSVDVPLKGIVKSEFSSPPLSRSSMVLTAYGFADGRQKKPKGLQKPAVKGARTSLKNSLQMTLVHVAAGKFEMGAIPLEAFIQKQLQIKEQPGANRQVQLLELITLTPPIRVVSIDKDFHMGATEVTIAQFRQFVEATEYQTEAERDGKGGTGLLPSGRFGVDPNFNWETYGFPVTGEHPVGNVSWNDAVAFCQWLSKKESRTYRLPTEAEWEYACRAGTRSAFSSGKSVEDLEGFANIADQALLKTQAIKWAVKHDDGHPFIAPVSQFRANDYGLSDMHGNLIEWCADEFHFAGPLNIQNPAGDPVLRVLRGGNWFNEPVRTGSACRIGAESTLHNSLTGFRVVFEAIH